MDRLLRKQFIAAVMQATEGTFVAPTLADTLIVGDIKATPLKADFLKRKTQRGFLGNAESLLVNKGASFSFSAELGGSGTAGVAPQHGKLLRACAMSETILGAAHNATAQAGAAGSITLAVGASAVDDAYQGMLISITGGTGNGQERVIADYVGATKVATVNDNWTTPPDATSTYSIAKQVAYNPISDNFEMLSLVYEDNGLYHKASDLRGSAKFSLKVKELPQIDFDMIGLPVSRVVGALAGVKPTIQKPAPVLTAHTSMLRVFGVDYAWQEFNVDLAVQTGHALLVGAEKIQVNDRVTVGSLVIDATAAQEDTLLTAVENATTGAIWLTHGTGAGHRHVISLRNAQLTQTSDHESEGRKLLGFNIEVPPSAVGNDEITYALV